MEYVLAGSQVILNVIWPAVIDKNLTTFSITIQQLFHVQDVQSERKYLIERCAQQSSFFYTITHRERR